ncbi:pentapeptide repeat-containing protein [Streptomyces sp. NPDC013953]|uniref:pentapeptide repeat-containing protein n=1 Tax=Streptomyces sp. NPDC013953 TaxID=3364868 RepID=UPI0036FB07AA
MSLIVALCRAGCPIRTSFAGRTPAPVHGATARQANGKRRTAGDGHGKAAAARRRTRSGESASGRAGEATSHKPEWSRFSGNDAQACPEVVQVTVVGFGTRGPSAAVGDATFTGDALFGDATFAGPAWFGNATFSGSAHFGDATFTGDPLFVGARVTHLVTPGDGQLPHVWPPAWDVRAIPGGGGVLEETQGHALFRDRNRGHRR